MAPVATTLSGGNGNDNLTGGAGNDFLDGGQGYDRAIYSDATSGVTIDLNITGTQSTGGSGMDTLTRIEAVNGSSYDDVLIGNVHNNILSGAAGNDRLIGGGGNDQLNGGSGFDTADFSAAAVGVHIDLSNAAAQNTRVGLDTLTSIEALIGSAYNDVLTCANSGSTLFGGDGIDKLTSGDGNDTIHGGSGDDKIYGGSGTDHLMGDDGNDRLFANLSDGYSDTFDGGAGNDTLEIDESQNNSSYYIDLVRQGIYDGGSPFVAFSSVETIVSDSHSEGVYAGVNLGISVYNGNSAAVLDTTYVSHSNVTNVINLATGVCDLGNFYGFTNVKAGNANNTITGSDGNDTITSGSGDDTIFGGDGNDTITSGEGPDLIFGGDGNDTIHAGDGYSTLDGGAGDDVLSGGGGNGVYTVAYGSATAGVSVSLAIHTAQNTIGAGKDKIASGIENLTGSNFADTLSGDTKANTLDGGLGGDTLTGGGGADNFAFTTTLGPDNIDTITDFTPGTDTIDLDHTIFTGLATGALAAGAFDTGAAASDADDRIIYNSATGALFFDSDGTGSAAQVQFATPSTGLSLSSSSFVVT